MIDQISEKEASSDEEFDHSIDFENYNDPDKYLGKLYFLTKNLRVLENVQELITCLKLVILYLVATFWCNHWIFLYLIYKHLKVAKI